ncbi:MAG: hypothetical protein R3B09_34850 [Nannocystaceae bacterium]
MNRRWGRLAGLAAALVSAACEAPIPDFEGRSGEHVVYSWQSGLTPCAGNVAALEAFVVHVSSQLDLAVPASIEYVWLTREEFEGWLPQWKVTRAGIASGRRCFAIAPLLLHEVVHTVDDLGGERTFFVEGLANAFALPLSSGPRYPIRDPRPYLTANYVSSTDEVHGIYAYGAGFVAYLLSRRGVARFTEFYGRLGGAASEAKIRRVFAEVYGLDFDVEVDTYLEDPSCPDDAIEVPQPFACAAPTIPWSDPDAWVDARILECGDEAVSGGFGGELGGVVGRVSVEIPSDGEYWVTRLGDTGGSVRLGPCGPCPWLAEDVAVEATPLRVTLRAGLYAAEYGAARVDALVGLSILRIREDGP